MATPSSGSEFHGSATSRSGRRHPAIRISPLLFLALGAGAAAFFLLRNTGLPDGGSSFAGRWHFDEETRGWLERTCVDVAFGDTATAFVTIEVNEDRAQIQFSDVNRTRLGGDIRRSRLIVRQLIPTSDVGRFCGRQTTIDISWRVVEGSPDELVGRWATPGCDVCPERDFGAIRVEHLSP